MTKTFNLIDERWIPCINADGTMDELSLRLVFEQAQTLRELSGESPLVIVALHRLLLTILHKVLGPASWSAWSALWERQPAGFDLAKLNGYLDRPEIYDRFYLFHPERPFMQAADPRVKEKSITAMIHDVASGNNATLFDHHLDEDGIALTQAQAARYLLAAQAFGLAGLSGLDDKFSYAPCVGGVLFLIQGDSLFETLLLNLIQYPSPNFFTPHTAEDKPVWEQADPFAKRSFPSGYLDYLTWQNRRILLTPPSDGDDKVRTITMAPGLKLDGTIHEPLKHYRHVTKADKTRAPMALRFNEERALWRDSSALFRIRKDDQTDFQPPRALVWNAELVNEGYLPKRSRQLLALGMANDQAKTEFFRAERMPLPPEYLQDKDQVDQLQSLLTLAENISNQLWGSTNTLACYLVKPDYDPTDRKSRPRREDIDPLLGSWGVLRHYWARLEPPFQQVIVDLPVKTDETIQFWQEILRATARDALSHITDNLETTPRALKATVKARGQLEAGLAKEIPA